jgi:hypothetical protein
MAFPNELQHGSVGDHGLTGASSFPNVIIREIHLCSSVFICGSNAFLTP